MAKLEAKVEKFLEALKNLHINISCLDAISEMLFRVKFLKKNAFWQEEDSRECNGLPHGGM